jgi:hypothetical protein
MFPNILNFISNDLATPWLHYAVVLNGKLMATNNKMATYIDVCTFCESEEQIKAIEGKVFGSEDLISMRGEYINFTESGYSIKGFDTEINYPGIIGQNREIQLYDDLMEDYNLARGFKKFPDFSTIIPALTDHDIDVVKVQKRNTHFRGCGVAVPQMTAIANAFQQSKDDRFNLRFEFFHAAKEKDKVDKPSAPILVTPFSSKFPLYKEACIINPVMNNPVTDNSDLI